MIVDVHAHAFPRLDGACGYASRAEHLHYMQVHLAVRGPVVDRTGPDFGADEDVDFRVGRFGRLEWRKDGAVGWTQWMPPSLQAMEAPPELMIAQMDAIGVDHAVLYGGHVYGRLNRFLAECARRYPERLTGVAQISEPEGDQPERLDELRTALGDLGLKGLYYELEAFRVLGSPHHVDDRRYDPLWEEVSAAGAPVIWDIGRHLDPAAYLATLGRVRAVLERHPRLVSILSHFASYVRDPATRRIHHWDEILALAARPSVFLEVLQVQYPSTRTGDEYPFAMGQRTIEEAYRRLGAGKLVWGADMPALERACSYRQSLDYVRVHCRFLSARDKDRVLGGNAADLFGIGKRR